MRIISVAQLVAIITVTPFALLAQEAAPPPATAVTPNPPPSTKLEAFRPAAGSVVTMGYNNLGRIGTFGSILGVDVRELRDSRGNTVRGLMVDVYESQYRSERAFIDADEIPELIKGIDAVLEVQSNPTSFALFEVRYTTRDDLILTAYNDQMGKLQYIVQAGNISVARKRVDADDLRKVRGWLVLAQQKLDSVK
jgi:hypothetical protein